jgi:hypothetical protein
MVSFWLPWSWPFPRLPRRPPGGKKGGTKLGVDDILIFFRHKNSLFRHNRFSTLFFSMKIAESGKIVLVSCIIDFKDIHV